MTTTYQFQTSINCGNCVRAVTAFINEIPGVEHWEVDTTDDRKILTVKGKGLSTATIIAAVEDAGFDIQAI